jgi:LPXTG-motif cell wall-anchored protein
MLNAAFTMLAIAVSVGAVLTTPYLRGAGAAAPPWGLAAVHVVSAIGGLGCLLIALRGPPRGLALGTGSFGMIAAALIGLALLIGGGLLAMRIRKRRPGGMLIGIHATIAVSGFVVLAAYVLAG